MHINSNDLNNFQNEEMNTDEMLQLLIFRYRKQQRMLPIKCGFSMRGSAL